MSHRTHRGNGVPPQTTAERPVQRGEPRPSEPDENLHVYGEMSISTAGKVRRVLDLFSLEAADDLADLRRDRVNAGDPTVTLDAFARALGVVPKQIFQYEDGSKRWPGAILRAPMLSAEFREGLAEACFASCRNLAKDRACIVALGRAVERVKKYATHAPLGDDQRRALAAALWNFVDELSTVANELSEEPAK